MLREAGDGRYGADGVCYPMEWQTIASFRMENIQKARWLSEKRGYGKPFTVSGRRQ